MRISIPESQVKDPDATIQLEQAILEKIRAIPEVAAAGIATPIPTEPGGGSQVYARDQTYQSVPPLRRSKFLSPGLLSALGTRLIVGREFTWTETNERRPVAMVSENLARELWKDPRAAIGKQIRDDLTGPWREIVGVVGDMRDDGMGEKAPAAAYYPLAMNHFLGSAVVVRRTVYYVVRSKRAGSQGFLSDVQKAVWSVNPSLPLASVRTLEEIYDKSMALTSFTLVMLAIAGAMAVLIGLVGIYGVISYSVSQRRREMGIRLALGAQPRELTRLFITRGFVLALIGVAFGLAGSIALTRVLRSLLFEVNRFDPMTYVAVSLGLIGAVMLASYIPALRARRVDPIEALRSE